MDEVLRLLLAAIEATEQDARAAANDVGEHWSDGGELGESVYQENSNGYVACGPYDYMSWELRRFIARHDPASVLRRCAADRRIIERYRETCEIRDEIQSRGVPGWKLPPGDLDTWDRADREARILLDDVLDLADAYGVAPAIEPVDEQEEHHGEAQ